MKTKLKTKKTLLKRIKITKSGKILKKQNRNRHLKVKKDASTKHRKNRLLEQKDIGHLKIFQRLLAKEGRGLLTQKQ